MGSIFLYIGEFNSGFTNDTTISQNRVYECLYRFKSVSFASYGLALWRWSYIQNQNILAFNLTKFVDNRIQPRIHLIISSMG
jgi:hypothetical protein